MPCADCVDCPFDVEQNSLIHELHISIAPAQVTSFLDFCDANNIKALSVSFIDIHGLTMTHVMTAHIVKGSYTEAFTELKRLKELFTKNKFKIERLKIECNAQSNAVGSEYFEHHVRYSVIEDYQDYFLDCLATIDKSVKVSYNLKHKEENYVIPLVTIKSNVRANFQEFKAICDSLTYIMESTYGFTPIKKITELVWHDTNPYYDDIWSTV